MEYLEFSDQKILELANQNDPLAMNELGWRYDKGTDRFRMDKTKAYHWYLKSADTGYRIAQYNVGSMMHFGSYPENPTPNYNAALEWYIKAANQNEPDAQYQAGYLYETIYNDLENAIRWYLRACNNGQSQARTCLQRIIIHKSNQTLNWMLLQDQTLTMRNEQSETQRSEIRRMEKYITELECLPPDSGGVMFQKHRDHFYSSE